MKTIPSLLVVLLAVFTPQPAHAVVGYVNLQFQPGDNLFHNPMDAGLNSSLTNLIPTPPANTSVSLWNPTSRTFDIVSVFQSGAWSINLQLQPGTGARLTTSSAFINAFIGEVVTRDGSPFSESPIPQAQVFSGPNGIYLLGDKFPVSSSGTDVFFNIAGRLPNGGEQVTRLNAATQAYVTSTYLGGTWDAIPTSSVRDAVFLNIGPVPEPSGTLMIGMSGLVLLAFSRRRASR